MKKDIGIVSSEGLVCIHKDKPMQQAYDLMKKISSRHLPVVDDSGSIIGMLSDRDIKYAMEFRRWEKWSANDPEPYFHDNDYVLEFMSWPIQTIDSQCPIAEAAELMIKNKISSLVVIKDNMAKGIVTTEDLLKILLQENKNSLETLKDKMTSYIYNTPIGGVAHMLSNVGI